MAGYKTGYWQPQEREQLTELIRQGLQPAEIAVKLNRPLSGVRSVISKMSLIPSFNRAMLEGAARRCLLNGKDKAKKTDLRSRSRRP